MYSSAYRVTFFRPFMNRKICSAASANKLVRILFRHLSGPCPFFSTFPKIFKVLDEIVYKRLPRSSPTRWHFQFRGVNNVYEYKGELIDVVETLKGTAHIK